MDDFKKLRLEQKMTQAQVAEKANISLRQLVRIENKECYPSLETKILLFKALNIENNEIIKYIKENYLK
ncbi:MAG: helix-turn-helix transcriptional regulator [Clostridia bacterium]|nr:helix-turn-helix transcriptional regulator [Clostridia bacterium]